MALNPLAAHGSRRPERFSKNNASATDAPWRLAALDEIRLPDIPDIHLAHNGFWELWVLGDDPGIGHIRIRHSGSILCVDGRCGVPWQSNDSERFCLIPSLVFRHSLDSRNSVNSLAGSHDVFFGAAIKSKPYTFPKCCIKLVRSRLSLEWDELDDLS